MTTGSVAVMNEGSGDDMLQPIWALARQLQNRWKRARAL
jgi:hypothetical protein